MDEQMTANDHGLLPYSFDILFILAWAVVATVSVFVLESGNIIRIILGFPLIIFLPGYSITCALWTARSKLGPEDAKYSKQSLSPEERIAYSFGLSLLSMAFVGLAMNYTVFGITLQSTVAASLSIIGVCSGLALWRRAMMPESARFWTDFSRLKITLPKDRAGKVTAVLIAVCLVASGCLLGYVAMTPGKSTSYTEFYILGEDGTTSSYPNDLATNAVGLVIVGVNCHERGGSNYSILIGLENATKVVDYHQWFQPIALNQSVVLKRSEPLKNGDAFRETFRFTIGTPGSYSIVFRLLLDGMPSDYELHMSVKVHAY